MTPFSIRRVQERLIELGYDPGEPDGVLGRRTRTAVADFQLDRPELNIQRPGTIGPKTLAALGLTEELRNDDPSVPWFDEVMGRIGWHETRADLKAFLKSDGKTLGDPSSPQNPWCGDLVQTAIALTLPDEVLPGTPYSARAWLNFGRSCQMQVGAVVVFWRINRTGSKGHVGFVAGQNDDSIYVLGGNQSNRICIAPVSRGRLLGFRWPLTYQERHIATPEMHGGAVSKNES